VAESKNPPGAEREMLGFYFGGFDRARHEWMRGRDMRLWLFWRLCPGVRGWVLGGNSLRGPEKGG
jgi:hypothetical protein